jgi:hypothetical protein
MGLLSLCLRVAPQFIPINHRPDVYGSLGAWLILQGTLTGVRFEHL